MVTLLEKSNVTHINVKTQTSQPDCLYAEMERFPKLPVTTHSDTGFAPFCFQSRYQHLLGGARRLGGLDVGGKKLISATLP